MKEKIKNIQNMLSKQELDGLFVTNPVSLVYTMGFKTEADTYLMVPAESNSKIQIFASPLEFLLIKSKVDLEIYEVLEQQKGTDLLSTASDWMREAKISKIGIEFDYLSHKDYLKLSSLFESRFEQHTIRDFSNEMKLLRTIKTPDEVENIKRASEIGMKGFLAIKNEIQSGMNEYELAAIAEYAMKRAGSQRPSFNTLVQTGPNSAYPHGSTTDRKVRDGDFVLVDLGATFNGYCSDLTRTFIFGEKRTQQQVEMMRVVNETNKVCREAVKEGVVWSDLHELSKATLAKYKMDQYYNHGLGHGVGIEIHEGPWLRGNFNKKENVLKENMIVTIEPGVYIEGVGGVRTEDLLVVKKDGYENLSPLDYYE